MNSGFMSGCSRAGIPFSTLSVHGSPPLSPRSGSAHSTAQECVHASQLSFTHTYIAACIQTYTCTCVNACIHASMHTCMDTCIYAYKHLYIRTHTYVHTHKCTHKDTHTSHTYTHTYTHKYTHKIHAHTSGGKNGQTMGETNRPDRRCGATRIKRGGQHERRKRAISRLVHASRLPCPAST